MEEEMEIEGLVLMRKRIESELTVTVSFYSENRWALVFNTAFSAFLQNSRFKGVEIQQVQPRRFELHFTKSETQTGHKIKYQKKRGGVKVCSKLCSQFKEKPLFQRRGVCFKLFEKQDTFLLLFPEVAEKEKYRLPPLKQADDLCKLRRKNKKDKGNNSWRLYLGKRTACCYSNLDILGVKVILFFPFLVLFPWCKGKSKKCHECPKLQCFPVCYEPDLTCSLAATTIVKNFPNPSSPPMKGEIFWPKTSDGPYIIKFNG